MEIIHRFGLPRSLQSDNGPSFKSSITDGVSKALRPWGLIITSIVPGDPNPQAKWKRAINDTIKRHLWKLSQETSQDWIASLPIALYIWNTPIKCGLSPFEMFYGRPFLTTDLLIDREAIELTQHVTSLTQFQQAICQLSEAQPWMDQKPLFNPGVEVIRSLPSLSPTLQPV